MNPNLGQYLNERQDDALLIETLLSAATLCVNSRPELLFTLIDAASDAAKQLKNGLDSTNLPKGGEE